MDLSESQRTANDMTKSGRTCWNEGCESKELEKVTGEERYTCHFCGAIYERILKKGNIFAIEVYFGGSE